MARPGWLAPWKDSGKYPVIYYTLSRFNGRFLEFHEEEKEKFRTLMRMTEKFTGCRVPSYCIMSNHFHPLLEVPPMPKEGLSDAELFRRLEVFYPAWRVKEVRQWLETAREAGNAEEAAQITGQFTYRMHDLSEFMKTLLQRFCPRSAHATREGCPSSGAPLRLAA